MMIDLSEAALMPIDMQMAFDAPPWPPRWNQAIDDNGRALLGLWRARGWPIFHVRHDSIDAGSTLRPGMPGNAFRTGFGPRDGEDLTVKSVNAAFIGTELDLRLRRSGIKTIVAFGISTDMCVSTTVRMGANLGYKMVLIADACDCFDLPSTDGETIPAKTVHDVHIATLAFDFATVRTTRQICAVIRAIEAGHPG